MSVLALGPSPSWQTLSGSARGVSHERTGLPNQDFGGAATLDHGAGAIIAVADGHGDELHARSDRGARFATEAAAAALRSWIDSANGNTDGLRAAAACLPETIVRIWREKVSADLARDLPRDSEMNFQHPEKAEIVRRSPEVLYGSTLIAAAINEHVAAYLQIGDGDLLAIGADDKVTRLVPGRDDLLINQTESLCQSDAQARFRVRVDILDGRREPALVMAATDGYCNSYAGDDGAFFKVATDIKAYLERHGPQWVGQHIEGWLQNTSETGSGDDITVALAWHGSQIASLPPPRWRRWWRCLLQGLLEVGRRLVRIILILVLIAAIGATALWIARDHLRPAWKDHAIEWVHKAVQKARDILHIGPRGESPPAPTSGSMSPTPFPGDW